MKVLRTIISLIIGLSTLPMSHAKVLIDTEQPLDQMRHILENLMNSLEENRVLEQYSEADLLDTADYALKSSDLKVNKEGLGIINIMLLLNNLKKIKPHHEYPTDVYFEKKPSLKANVIRFLDNLPKDIDHAGHFKFLIQFTQPSEEWEKYIINHYNKAKISNEKIASTMIELLTGHAYQSKKSLAVIKDALNQNNPNIKQTALEYAITYTPSELFPILIQILEFEAKNQVPVNTLIQAICSYGALGKPYTALMRERVAQAGGILVEFPEMRQALEKNIDQIEALPEPEPEPKPKTRSKSFNTLVVIALGLTLVLTGFFFLKPKA